MTGFELYTFFLCLIVFTIFVALFLSMLIYIVKLMLRVIRSGLDDDKIKEEYEKEKKNKNKYLDFISNLFSIVFSIVFILVFVGSVGLGISSESKTVGDIPVLRVVQSESMSEKHENNKYLEENELNNQFDMFDIVVVEKLPEEDDIQLYDIVVYEIDDGVFVIHRVIGIEEPNEKHPDNRHFLLRGDANKNSDQFPVTYDQMVGIYKGQRIQYVGSLVMFLQSPAGYLCILLVLFYLIATPIVEKKIASEKMKRLMSMGVLDEDEVGDLIDENEVIVNPFEGLNLKEDKRTFKEKLYQSDDILKQRYINIANILYQIDKAHARDSKKFETYKAGYVNLAKFSIRGKTLNIYLGLNPSEYVDTKYIFTDESGKKTYINFPMRVKITSDRKAKWVNELIGDIVKRNNLNMLNEPIKKLTLDDLKEEVEMPFEEVFTQDYYTKDHRTFKEKLFDSSEEVKLRYITIANFINRIKDVRVRESKKFETSKVKNLPIAKLTFKGKTLNAYLGLDPSEFENTKYIYEDASNVNKYLRYPLRVKVSSARKAKWVNELINQIILKNNLQLREEPIKIITLDDLRKVEEEIKIEEIKPILEETNKIVDTDNSNKDELIIKFKLFYSQRNKPKLDDINYDDIDSSSNDDSNIENETEEKQVEMPIIIENQEEGIIVKFKLYSKQK